MLQTATKLIEVHLFSLSFIRMSKVYHTRGRNQKATTVSQDHFQRNSGSNKIEKPEKQTFTFRFQSYCEVNMINAYRPATYIFKVNIPLIYLAQRTHLHEIEVHAALKQFSSEKMHLPTSKIPRGLTSQASFLQKIRLIIQASS